MKSLYNKKVLKKYWFQLAVFGILLISIFFRFYLYNDRWALAYDQARDTIVAKYAITHGQFPLLGPFSSAGPFQTGAEWYWFVMVATAIFPFAVMTPWVMLSLIYVFFVYVIIYVAKEIVDKKFALLAGLFAAISTAQVDQSTNLTNPSLVPIFSLLAIWAMVTYIKREKNNLYLFLLALFIGIAISIHMQGVGLLFLLIFTVVGTRSFKLKNIGAVLFGLALPFIPFLISELQHNFFNTHNLLYYYLHDQYNVSFEVLGRRWKTYLGVFVPTFWSYVIGGYPVMGYVLSGLFVLIFSILLYKRKISSIWIILILTLVCDIYIIKNTRSPLFYGYLTFLHPSVLLLSAWILYIIIKKYKYVGFLFLLLIVGSTVFDSMKSIIATTKGSARSQIESAAEFLKQKYPDRQIVIYDYNLKANHLSHPLMLFLWNENKINKNGYKIGLGTPKKNGEVHSLIKGNPSGIIIRDLNSSSSAELKKEGWKKVDPESIYNSIENWH